MRLLLDTSAYSALKRGHAGVVGLVRGAERLLLSTIVAGELLYGFRRGTRYPKNRRELEAFLANPYVELVPVTLVTADRFGRIAAGLRRKGRPIPTHDIWVAAHALETGAELVSCDRHFEAVEGLVSLLFEA
ncbi:MAG: PIN domain-containing protein [Planctomycetota bacterium]|jgi:tRNA(fMet)-specific endonuclease VapC